MSKRKILLVAMALCMVAILAGTTLAYLTDTDSAKNTFTVGNVKIDLIEKFDPNNSKLMPGRNIEKVVTVQNTGSEECYVRVHIAIPSNMNDGDPNQAAINNFLHFNFSPESVVDGQWSWNETADGANYPTVPGEWNFYTATIEGIAYDVYVVTYETALAANAVTATAAMHNVYMDVSVDAVANADGTITYTDSKGNTVTLDPTKTVDIHVFAQGVQKEGFDNAFDAFNAAYAQNNLTNPWQ